VLRYMRISLLSLMLILFLIGLVYSECPVGDLNGGCQVNWADMQVFAEKWLAPPESSADLNGDDRVNMGDFALLAEQWGRTGIALVINEFMASNSSCIRDPQGQYDDWIEIHNYGPDAINTGGMYLTDDLSVPDKWRIPDNNPALTTIGAGGYLLIWADNDTADAGLHANFKLDADGEQIGLFDRDGVTLVDSVGFFDQTTDMSYGRCSDANDSWRFFAFPSPGAENVGVYLGFVTGVEFSHKRGFYDTPFSVTLATETENAAIYYTLDGSEPYNAATGRRLPTGMVYTSPIPIGTTACLRAKAIRHGWKPSEVRTQTYIFPDDVIRQPAAPAGFPSTWGLDAGSPIYADYEMDPDIVNNPLYSDVIEDALLTHRTISLVLDPDDLFDTQTGIYSNSRKEGVAWERFGRDH